MENEDKEPSLWIGCEGLSALRTAPVPRKKKTPRRKEKMSETATGQKGFSSAITPLFLFRVPVAAPTPSHPSNGSRRNSAYWRRKRKNS